MDDRRHAIALFRYSLVREAADPALTTRQRGALVRQSACTWVWRKRPQVFGRFEAAAPNLLWTGDALHGPAVDGRKTYLFAFINDHSRLLVGYRWGLGEDTLRLEAALRAGLAARGVPAALYVDNGSAFVSKQLERACAVLGVRLIHSRPGQPAGRGKIERVFRTVREQFLVELAARPSAARTWPSSTGCSKPGSRASTTAAHIRRPASRRWSGSLPAGRRSCPLPPSCATPSCGPGNGR